MKNLKRVLSLALATVMLLGVMVVGSNAAFSDQSSIKYDEAVDFMVGLGVISGVGQNQFQPNGTLTRAQAAQLVAMVKAGANKNTIAYYDGNTKFTDVGANHNWAKAAINYCVANGIIAGQTANTYAPDAPLTGVALAKMMLVALGYPATSEKDTETLVGPNWQVNTLRKATAAGLFKDLDSSFVAVKNITREEAAQMMFNALYSDVVEAKTWDMYGNPQYQVQTGKKLITTCFDMVEVKGVVTGNAATGAKGTMTDGTHPTAGITASSTYALETGLDMIGHNVTILVKTDKNDKAVLDENQNVVTYGIVDNATLATSYVTSGKGIEEDLKAAGFSKNAAGQYANGKSVDSNYQLGTTTTIPTGPDGKEVRGKQIVAISNSNDMTVDYIILVESYLNKVTTVKTTGTGKDAVTTYSFKETAGFGATSKTNDKVNVYEGIAKDDYVIVTKTASDFYNVEKVATVDTTVSRLNKSGAKLLSVVAGGATYGPSGVDATDMATTANKVTAFTGTTTGKCILLLDGEGKLIATAEGAASVSFAYVAEIAPESGYDENNMLVNDMPKAMVYFADGTKGAYFVDTTKSDTNDDATDEGAEFVEGFKGVYNVVLGADNKVVITKAAGTAETTTAWAIKKGVSKVDGASGIYTNSDTVVFFVNGSYGTPGFSVTVQTGTANISAIAASKISGAQVGAADPAGNKFVSAMLVSEAPSDGKVEVLYYNGVFSVEQNGSNFTTHYTVYKDGVETTVSYEKVNKDNAVTTPGFCTSGGTNLNMIASGDEATNKVKTDATPTAFVGGTLTAGDDYQVTDSTVVLNLVPETTLSLEDILNGDVVTVADSRIAVSYTEDPVSHVKTATAVYITAATLVTP